MLKYMKLLYKKLILLFLLVFAASQSFAAAKGGYYRLNYTRATDVYFCLL